MGEGERTAGFGDYGGGVRKEMINTTDIPSTAFASRFGSMIINYL